MQEIIKWLKPALDERIKNICDEQLEANNTALMSIIDYLRMDNVSSETIQEIEELFVMHTIKIIEITYMCGVEEMLKLKAM
ncbi:hypothetical protein SAMN04487895_10345 [Paenibacillus sophorae]|uniref:Uncharacterized protein n=1 Tax=Paenibacillus sophorae TaxID=1333845 RepID=A0A1H8JJK9_9BACL|nr:hypothetical protein [Paenibacillus sophorae]QWU13380.1 hypothetical protein KP014_15375 [Paenibacillus sophorae]SEN80741.1 hypothetical protein SAMN04487895_10345 [Paenibacillus sophorae]